MPRTGNPFSRVMRWVPPQGCDPFPFICRLFDIPNGRDECAGASGQPPAESVPNGPNDTTRGESPFPPHIGRDSFCLEKVLKGNRILSSAKLLGVWIELNPWEAFLCRFVAPPITLSSIFQFPQNFTTRFLIQMIGAKCAQEVPTCSQRKKKAN